LSFDGEKRPYVAEVAAALRDAGIACFYDTDSAIALWGKNQVVEFQRVFRDAATVVVVFVSAEYAAKAWTSHEFRSALERAITEKREYVLPVRFDDTALPGLDTSLSYLRADEYSPERLAAAIAAKLRDLSRQ
jgi:hypothetical protein